MNVTVDLNPESKFYIKPQGEFFKVVMGEVSRYEKGIVTEEDLRYFFYGGAIRGGKLLPLDTPIPTPGGWTTMGELSVGDVVIDRDGKPTTVVWVSDVNENPESWELFFDDGSSQVCDIGHQWVTTTYQERCRIYKASDVGREKRRLTRPKRGTGKRPDLALRNAAWAKLNASVPDSKGATRTTEEIINTLRFRGFANHAIVNCDPIELPEIELSIKPYTLGAWLGDGTSSSGGFTGIDKEVWEGIESDGYTVVHHKNPQSHLIKGISVTLREMGLKNNKHIPREYLRGSIKQRIALLQGLCDTDGAVDKKSKIEFTTTTPALKDGIMELLYSLGIKPSCNENKSFLKGVRHKNRFRILFKCEFACFKIKRKLERQSFKLGQTRHYRSIIDARPAKQVPMKCIAVNSESHTYLCGKGMLPTHNSYICLAIFVFLAKMYNGSRWHVIRKAFPDINRTILPSATKMIGSAVRWKTSSSDCFCQFSNGSRIYFMAENIKDDPHLMRFNGLETNGIFMEQAEELREETFDKCLERIGSWLIEKIPFPIILSTFNPTHAWVKARIHDQHVKGLLKPPFYYKTALPKDNPRVTDEQWKSWMNMDDESYARFVEGKWDIKVENQFCYAFSEKNLTKGLSIDYEFEIILSFDFNVDPMTCLIIQTDRQSWSKTIKEFRIENSDTFEMCRVIKPYIEGHEYLVTVTGDASGSNRNAGMRDHVNHYHTIINELRIKSSQLEVPSSNPLISDSRMFCNSILSKLPECLIDEDECPFLVADLKYVLVDHGIEGDVQIKKSGNNPHAGMSNSLMGHLLDCWRYAHHVSFMNWLEIPHS